MSSVTGGYQVRLEALQSWMEDFIGGNADLTTDGELRSAKNDLDLAQAAGDILLSCLTDLYTLGRLTETVWAPSTAIAMDAIREPLTKNGYRYRCTVAGTTSTSQPVWKTVVGQTCTDGGVTWSCLSKTPELAWDAVLAAVDSELTALEGVGTPDKATALQYITAGDSYSAGDVCNFGAENTRYMVCTKSGTVSNPIDYSVFPTLGWPPFSLGTAEFLIISQEEARARLVGDNEDINAVTTTMGEPGFVRDIATFAKKYLASCNHVRALAGLLPKADAGGAGSACWQPCNGDYEWRINGLEYLPACTNVPYMSCVIEHQTDGSESIVSTQEFGFLIRCACPELLKEGDTITIIVEGGSAPSKTYQVGDTLLIPMIASTPALLSGGVSGDNTLTWSVRGSLGATWADYSAVIGSEALYSQNGLQFRIAQGAVPFGMGDDFLFSVSGGTFQWRKNSGSWSAPVTLALTALSLTDGLSVTFQPGPAPSFVVGDAWAFQCLRPHAATLALTPARDAWRWTGSSATWTATFATDKTLTAVSLWHDCPAGSTFALKGMNASNVVLWTKAMTYRAGLTVMILEGAGAVAACRKLQVVVDNATGGSIRWVWAGTPWTPINAASGVNLTQQWTMRRGLQTARYLSRGSAGEITWSVSGHSWLSSADWAHLSSMIHYLKTQQDEPFVFVPNASVAGDARLVRVGDDAITLSDTIAQFQDISRQAYDIKLPLAAVPL
jgi:hypothetical protein